MEYNRKVIHCPIVEDHPRKRILLVLGDNELNIYCKEHHWLRIILKQNGRTMNFKGVTAVIKDFDKPVDNFNLEPIPVIAEGVFKNKRKKKNA